MALLVFSLMLVAGTAFLVRPAVVDGARIGFSHFDGRGVIVVFGAVVTVAVFLGIGFALALLAAAMVHELGRVLGHRLAGHDGARFRLLPLPGAAPVSARVPESSRAAVFGLLMGPGLGLAPMVAAFALDAAFAETAPQMAHAARTYALAAGAFNLVALLPLLPLPGGRLTRMVIEARFPGIGGVGAAALAAFVIGLALSLGSALLFLLGLAATLTLVLRPSRADHRPPMTRPELHLAFAAYFATLGAYFLGGWWVLKLFTF